MGLEERAESGHCVTDQLRRWAATYGGRLADAVAARYRDNGPRVTHEASLLIGQDGVVAQRGTMKRSDPSRTFHLIFWGMV
jgi:hypothetical protein